MAAQKEYKCSVCGEVFTSRRATSRLVCRSSKCIREFNIRSSPPGFCTACFKRPAVNGRVRCGRCLEKARGATKRYLERHLGADKTCRHCSTTKPASHFMSRVDTYGGVTSWCKACSNLLREAGLSYCGKCDNWKESRDFHNTKYSSSKRRTVCVACTTGKTYGLTGDEYTEIGDAQNWECAICYETVGRGGKRLHTDHCHATGQVRGFLCDDCNRGLGMLKDSPDLLDRAAAYLRNPPAKLYLGVKLAPVERERDLEEYLN